MDHQYIPYLLLLLLALLCAGLVAYFVRESRNLTSERRQQQDNQARRLRDAEQRMAANGGRPLSARPAHPEGSRRPGEISGSNGLK